MNRADRLRAALTGTGLEDEIDGLATLPTGQVDLIVRALKASRAAALTDDRAKRRQRREDRRRGHWVENDQYSAATLRMLEGQARRASVDLEALASLAEQVKYGRRQLQLAAEGCIARGYSYTEIADALGISRQVAWKRFGRNPQGCAGQANTA